jgi:hypothetical protein
MITTYIIHFILYSIIPPWSLYLVLRLIGDDLLLRTRIGIYGFSVFGLLWFTIVFFIIGVVFPFIINRLSIGWPTLNIFMFNFGVGFLLQLTIFWVYRKRNNF